MVHAMYKVHLHYCTHGVIKIGQIVNKSTAPYVKNYAKRVQFYYSKNFVFL